MLACDLMLCTASQILWIARASCNSTVLLSPQQMSRSHQHMHALHTTSHRCGALAQAVLQVFQTSMSKFTQAAQVVAKQYVHKAALLSA